MKHNITLLFAVAFCVVLFSRCDKDPDPIEVNQAMLDNTNELFKSQTGIQNGQDFAHNGQPTGGASTVRDIFTADGTLDKVEPGTVVTKHTYNVSKDTLFVTYAMVKHQEGYWPEANDWEYIQIPFDATVDYTANPNGVLSKAALSGNTHEKTPGCVSCHAAAKGGDQLFSNDD